MKQKYYCYSLSTRLFETLFVFMFFAFSLWCIFDSTVRDALPIVIPAFFIVGACTFPVYFRTATVSDDEITADILAFLKKRTIKVCEIKNFHVTASKAGNTLVLHLGEKNGKEDFLKIDFSDERFIAQMSAILRKKFESDIEGQKAIMRNGGAFINASSRKMRFFSDGIQNLKTHEIFRWENIRASVEEKKNGIQYVFEIDKKVKFFYERSCFLFALEDFLDECFQKTQH